MLSTRGYLCRHSPVSKLLWFDTSRPVTKVYASAACWLHVSPAAPLPISPSLRLVANTGSRLRSTTRGSSSKMGETWGEEAPAAVAAALPHYAQGPIVKGFGRGSTELGFPTANFADEVIEALPEALIGGIYWGLAQVDDGQVYDMVMSIGWNPFYENKKRAMETHIVHKFEEADLYGRQLKVIILGFIRPEQNFDSLEALIDAIRKDIEEGKKRGSEESWAKYRADPCFQQIKV